MAVVDLTGSVAEWAGNLNDGLAKAGFDEAAAAFAMCPPFAGAEPTGADFEMLCSYVAARVAVLEDLLG